jgi:hypothetical protein
MTHFYEFREYYSVSFFFCGCWLMFSNWSQVGPVVDAAILSNWKFVFKFDVTI